MPLQTRLVDTRIGTGGLTGTLTPNTYATFTVNGQAGLPSTGIAAVVASVTVINDTPDAGLLSSAANTGGTTGTVTTVLYEANDVASNTVIIENGTDGKIHLISQKAVDVVVDIQGYLTVGNGAPAPGGFVGLPAATVTTITAPVAASTSTVQVTGVAGVPSTATAVYANLVVDNTAAGSIGSYVTPFAAGTNPPTVSLNYDAASKTALGTTIDLNAQGQLSIKFAPNAAPVSIRVDVIGYFDGEPSNAGFTPLGTRLYDSSTAAPGVDLPAGSTVDVAVTGVAGMPAYSPSISGIAMNVATQGTPVPGGVVIWPSDSSEPGVSTVEMDGGGSQQSNMTIVRPGADGKVKVKNTAASGWVRVVIDAQGYFTNTQNLAPAVGTQIWRSGSRGDAGMIGRALTDRVNTEVNPTTGNLLITRSLLSLTGIGQGVNVGVRYNEGNDLRPALTAGLFESQLFRNANNTITYTDPKDTTYSFSPVGNGTYSVPKNINAHLTRTVDGAPNAAVSAGATYELVFHPSQVKNVYVSDGNNLQLVRSEDITGSNKISYAYAGGKMTSITDTQGRVVNFGYTASPNPTQPTTITDTSLNRTITLAYNGPSGALSSVTDATGSVTTWAYDGNGKVYSITDGRGSRTDFTYSGADLKLASMVVGANNAAVSGTYTYAYTAGAAAQTVVTDPNGHTGTYQFNDTTKVIARVLDGLGNSNASQFNAHGDVTSASNGALDVTQYTVAASTFNLTKVTSPTGGGGGTGATGRTGEFTYPTALGNGATADYRPQSAKDAQGNTTDLTYNTWGQTATSAVGRAGGTGTPAGGTWSYKYQGGSGTTAATCGGKPGQLCQKIDGKGNTTNYSYNAAGNLATLTPPAGIGASTFAYDAAGRVTSQVDGKGTTTSTCYDKNDRITQVSTTSSNCSVASGVTFTYDQAGNTTTRKNATSTATWVFDAQNRATSKTETAGAVYSSTVTYDRASNVLTAVDGGTGAGNTTTYRYDAANNLIALAVPGGSCPASPAVPVTPNATGCLAFSYDAANRRTQTYNPNGVTTSTSYDGSSRPTSITTRNTSSAVLVSRAYTYTATTGPAADTALIGTVTDQAGNITTYGYDPANRLTAATAKNSGGTTTGTQAWTFDLNGNRTQQATTGTALGAAGTTNYAYNAADQLCWSAPGASGTCTPPGGATTYTYDGAGNQTSGGNTWTGFNQLGATTTGGALTHTYAGTSNNERFSSTGTQFTTNTLGQVTGEKTTALTTKYVRDNKGTLIGMQTTSSGGGVNTYYATNDNVGSVLLLTDATQATAASYTYDPYGNPLTSTGPQAGTNHYRYATGYTDPTGLTKMGARYYNPVTGRFTQPEPSGQETNNYTYTNNNPISYNDPSGLTPVDLICGLAGLAAGAFAGGPGLIGVGVTCAAYSLSTYIVQERHDPNSGGTFCYMDNMDQCITYVDDPGYTPSGYSVSGGGGKF